MSWTHVDDGLPVQSPNCSDIRDPEYYCRERTTEYLLVLVKCTIYLPHDGICRAHYNFYNRCWVLETPLNHEFRVTHWMEIKTPEEKA